MTQARAISALLLLVALVGCSPAPTPPPTSSASVETAAEAYSAFLAAWTSEYASEITGAAEAADSDSTLVALYATTLADAYPALADGIGAIDYPAAVRPDVDALLDAIDVLVGLATRLADTPSDISLKTELQQALARVGQRSARLESALGVSH